MSPNPSPALDERWRSVSAARLPASALPALAPVRDQAEVRVLIQGEMAWAYWPMGRDDVIRYLLPVAGTTFYSRRGGEWFPFGSRLPTSDGPPEGEGRPIASLLVPQRFSTIPPGFAQGMPVRLGLARGGEPQPASALVCSLNAISDWADRATTAELAAVRAARAGGRAVLLGARLPSLSIGTRYWGDGVLVPIGFRPEPDLPPAALRAAIGLENDELGLLGDQGVEIIPRSAFEPLTRAGLRLAIRLYVG